MEFTKLVDAVAYAARIARLMNEPRYVLKGLKDGQRVFWTCTRETKKELWNELTPVHVCHPEK